MAKRSQSNRVRVPEAGRFLDQFKHEVAHDIGVNPPQDGYWGDMPARQCGAVGGHMVRRMIEMAEQQLAHRGTGATLR